MQVSLRPLQSFTGSFSVKRQETNTQGEMPREQTASERPEDPQQQQTTKKTSGEDEAQTEFLDTAVAVAERTASDCSTCARTRCSSGTGNVPPHGGPRDEDGNSSNSSNSISSSSNSEAPVPTGSVRDSGAAVEGPFATSPLEQQQHQQRQLQQEEGEIAASLAYLQHQQLLLQLESLTLAYPAPRDVQRQQLLLLRERAAETAVFASEEEPAGDDEKNLCRLSTAPSGERESEGETGREREREEDGSGCRSCSALCRRRLLGRRQDASRSLAMRRT